MARLPIPGGDNGNWGNILNDYLLQAHDTDGSLKDGSITEAKLSGPVQTKLNAGSSAPEWSTIVNKPSFIAAGADAAAARTIINAQSKVVLDPRDFDPNLVFNNAYDCTAGIQAALDAAQTYDMATVQLPAGIGKVTGLTIHSDTILQGHGDRTNLLLTGGSNNNLIQSDAFGHATNNNRGIVLRDFAMNGNQANQSATLHPHAYLTADFTAGVDTIATVDDASAFASSGTLWIGYASITYTGKTSNTFTGCTVNNIAGLVKRGAWVTPVDSKGHLIAIQGHRCRLSNLLGLNAAGSGVYFQGPHDGQYQSENVIDTVRMEGCRRFGFEIGENAPDGQSSKLVTGDRCLMGGAIFRSGDWTIDDFHPTGMYSGYIATGPALTICASYFRMSKFFPDTWPGSAIAIDLFPRGGTRINDIQVSEAITFRGGLSGGHAVLFRGPGTSTGQVERVNLAGLDTFSPFDFVISNGPLTMLVGAQNLASPPNGKIQVKSALDFQPSSAVGGPVNISTDVLSYTGRQMSGAFIIASHAIGATTLNVDSTTGFDSSGSIVVVTPNSAGTGYSRQTLTYTGKTSTSFTGIPASSTGSITTTIYAGAVASQHFLTGITGGALTSVANDAQVFSSTQVTTVSEMQLIGPMFRSFMVNRVRMQAADDWQLLGGTTGGKKMRGLGTATIAVAGTSVAITHGLAEAPTRIILSPTADTQGRRYWVSARTSTTFTITLDSAASGSAITFDWVAELTT